MANNQNIINQCIGELKNAVNIRRIGILLIIGGAIGAIIGAVLNGSTADAGIMTIVYDYSDWITYGVLVAVLGIPVTIYGHVRVKRLENKLSELRREGQTQ